jgi:hypothetical protein
MTVPMGGIVAVSDPDGCMKLGEGWADANLGGKFVVGATPGVQSKWPFNAEGGTEAITIQGKNIPVPTVNIARPLSASLPGVGYSFDSMFNTVTFSPKPAAPINTLPPFKALYFCVRVAPK